MLLTKKKKTLGGFLTPKLPERSGDFMEKRPQSDCELNADTGAGGRSECFTPSSPSFNWKRRFSSFVQSVFHLLIRSLGLQLRPTLMETCTHTHTHTHAEAGDECLFNGPGAGRGMISPESRAAAQPQVKASVGTTETSRGTAAPPSAPPGRCGRPGRRAAQVRSTENKAASRVCSIRHPPASLPATPLSTSLSPDGQSGGFFSSPPVRPRRLLAFKSKFKLF